MDKLAKIMPMLSSSNEGEILNTVAAMKKILKSEGKDMHDLCSLLSNSRNSGSYSSGYSKANANQGYDFNAARNRASKANEANALKISKIMAAELVLSDWETSFLESILQQMKDGKTLSKKQSECLEKIYVKLGEK